MCSLSARFNSRLRIFLKRENWGAILSPLLFVITRFKEWRIMKFTAESKIKDIISTNPKTADLMRDMGMHCLGCPSASNESVSGAARMHGMETSKLLQALNELEVGEMSQDTLADTMPKGAILQGDRVTYAVVPHIPAGICSPDLLRKIADVAEKYESAALKLTSAHRIAIVGLKKDDVAKVWADLGMEPGHAAGACVRSIKVCPGTTFCKRGLQDSVTLGLELDKRYHGVELPTKFKLSVSGCANKCTDTANVDLGFMGTQNGFHAYVGGNGGVKPRLADLLAQNLSAEQALELAEKVVRFFKLMGRTDERIGKMIDRMGLEQFKQAVLG
jgi:hybrid cluster-associated redox disulfide protein